MEDELMKRLLPVCLLAAALGATASAQDNTVKSKTQVKTDDAQTVYMRGCLAQNTSTGIFTLTNATAVTGDDLTAKSKVKTDVDRDDTTVTSRTKVDTDARGVGTSGVVGVYEITGREGVNLSAHVGHQVQIAAVMVPAGSGDADVKVKEQTKTKNDNAPDSKNKTTTKTDIDRGATPRLAAVSLTQVSDHCTP
jgi:hypothetical protein